MSALVTILESLLLERRFEKLVELRGFEPPDLLHAMHCHAQVFRLRQSQQVGFPQVRGQ